MDFEFIPVLLNVNYTELFRILQNVTFYWVCNESFYA
jgi:hypothetical protein